MPPAVHPVEDPDDARLVPFLKLYDRDLRQTREGAGIFIAEGLIVLERLLRSAYPIISVATTPRRVARVLAIIGDRDVSVHVVPEDVLGQASGYTVHRGILAAARRLPELDPATVLRDATRVALLEGLTDLENLGAIARSARALGIDALLLDPLCADPLYRRVVRVSMGHVLFLPWARMASVEDGLAILRQAGFEIIALTPARDAVPIAEIGRPRVAKIAIALGGEARGLSAALLDGADVRVVIPQRPDVDSLSVGHAAAIAFDRLCLR